MVNMCMCTVVKKSESQMQTFPAEAEQGKTLPCSFSSHTVNKYPFHRLFSALFSHFCGFSGDFAVKNGSVA